jgi:GT2 family glycosyltransferase
MSNMVDRSRTEIGEISASIVTYENAPNELSKLFNSISMSSKSMRVIVVDNSPSDKLRTQAAKYDVDYIWHGENHGFGAGHNIAINKTLDCAKYHLVVNPDVAFNADVIESLYTFMEEHPLIGLVMPQILYPDGSKQHLCKLLPSPFDLFLRRFLGAAGRVFLRNRWEQYELRDLDMSVVREVPNLSGCFMFMRTSVLRKVGVFDERYFMYLEDVDLCRRIGSVSQTVFYPHVSIVHGYAKGSYQSAELLRHHAISALKYFSKWGWFFDPQRVQLNLKTEVLQAEVPYHLSQP